MNANKHTNCDMNKNSSFSACNMASSIEDDIIDQRIRVKQLCASSSKNISFFKIELKKIECSSEERTFAILGQKKMSAAKKIEKRESLKNSSFVTAEDSLYRSNEFESPKGRDLSVLTTFEFDKTSERASSKNRSAKTGKKAEEVQLKRILGLSALASTFAKVQTKDVAFKFAHLKIFSQLCALNDKKKQSDEPTKASSRHGLLDKKQKFYRQWFKAHRSSQMTDVSSGPDAYHTLPARS